jgi:hypothetical protein
VTSFGSSAVLIADPIKKLSCTDVKIEDKADGWYRVTETYQSRMYPGESISGAPSAPVAPQGPIATKIYGPFPLFGGADWYGMNQNTQSPQTVRTTGAAQQAAASDNQSLTLSNDAAYNLKQNLDAYFQTSINPAWTTTVQPTADNSPILSASASAANFDAQTPDQGQQSASLPY